MRLSRQERRILEEIEEHLAREDPELAERLASGGGEPPGSPQWRRSLEADPPVEDLADDLGESGRSWLPAPEHPWPDELERPWPPVPESGWPLEPERSWPPAPGRPGSADPDAWWPSEPEASRPAESADRDGDECGGVLWIWGAVALLTLIAALVVTSVAPG